MILCRKVLQPGDVVNVYRRPNEYSTAGVVIKDKLFNQTRTVQL